MERISHEFDRWEVECRPADGARLSALRFAGRDLLTQAPGQFKPPKQDFGDYETRPVYGYDDCFPSVEPCSIPDAGWPQVRDHGELCWLTWDVSRSANRLDCCTRSKTVPAVHFRRTLHFGSTSVAWEFEVCNKSESAIPFQHVMHPLMPLDQVASLWLPSCARVVDERTRRTLPPAATDDCAAFLLHRPRGTATMLLLQNLSAGRTGLLFQGGMSLEIEFPTELFPTLGVWWNNAGYPDEDSCRRTECALEPIPGSTSSLAEVYRQNGHLEVAPGGRITWTIDWRIRSA